MTISAIGRQIEASSGSALEAKANAYGISVRGAGDITTGDNVIIATATAGDAKNLGSGATATSANVIGIGSNTAQFVDNGHTVITTDDNKIYVTAQGGKAESTGTYANADSSASTSGIHMKVYSNPGENKAITGKNKIRSIAIGGDSTSVRDGSSSATATGMHAEGTGSSINATGDQSIHAEATGGTVNATNTGSAVATAFGLRANGGNASITTIGTQSIYAKATGGTINGVTSPYATAGATAVGMYTSGYVRITAIGAQSIYTEATGGTINGVRDKAYAYALHAHDGGNITIDSQGEAVQLTGDISASIGTYRNGSITLSLDQEDSYWRPRFQDRLQDYSSISTNGSFGDGSFTMKNGGTLDVAWYANQGGYSWRNTSLTLTGNQININDGVTFIINSDIVNNEADTITANTTATGTQYVRVVYDPSMYQNGIYQTGTVNGIALVLDFDGANGQGITSTVDTALDVIEITPQMEGGYLKAITVTGPDPTDPSSPDTTPEALKTVSDFYQHQMNILKLEGNNSFMRRMGDVRLEDPEKHKGVWAHTFGGKLKFDGAYGRNSTQKYHGVEAGFDYNKEVQSGRLYYGPLISYRKADSSYSRGNGDIESIALGGYASWVSPKGHYVDVVMKAVHLDTDYHLYSNRNDGRDSERISADFGNWSYLMSGEYGYRHDLSSRTFIEPQAMLTLGRLSGKGYTASNGVRFQQEGMNLAVGRLSLLYGVNVGKEKNSNVYVKGSLIHDFSSTGGVTANYQGRSRLIDTAGDTGTSFELNVGANLQLSKKNQLYFELTKSFGGDVETDWQVNAGWQIRW